MESEACLILSKFVKSNEVIVINSEIQLNDFMIERKNSTLTEPLMTNPVPIYIINLRKIQSVRT